MKRTLACALVLSAAATLAAGLPAPSRQAGAATRPASAPAGMLLKDGDVVALCGDSITSSGAYPGFIELYQWMCCPQPKVTLMNFGRWGETAAQFPPVMDKDVLPAKPTVALICYGMNNCRSGRVMSDPAAAGWGDGQIMTVVKKFKDAGVRLVVLASPGCVDSTHFTLSQNAPPVQAAIAATQKNLSLLRDSAKRVAEREGLVFADMHTPMVEVMAKAKAKYGPDFAFAGGKGDGVHPGQAGHLVMTWVYLKALGYRGDVGTITLDLAKDQAEATEGHQVIAAKGGAVEVESARYPFCFLANPYNAKDFTGPGSTRSVADLFPFNDDLNRLLLVVRGAKSKRLKVTWGGQSKEFDAAALERGVNLAAEFLDNPFCPQLAKIAAALGERNRCRPWLRQPQFKDDPNMAKRLERASENMKVVPVKHTITVTDAV